MQNTDTEIGKNTEDILQFFFRRFWRRRYLNKINQYRELTL